MESQIITFEKWRYKSGTKGTKKALPLIITNSKAKKKGAHFEHLNYHLLSILIVVYHDLFPNTEMLEDIVQRFLAADLAAGDYFRRPPYRFRVFGADVAAHSHFPRQQYSGEGSLGTEKSGTKRY